MFISDVLFLKILADFEFANYADDSTPFSAKLGGKSVAKELEISSSILFTTLRNSYMKANTDKNHLLLSVNNITLQLILMEVLMNLPKCRMIMKAFITSQFGYCPLIWMLFNMFHSRTLNNKINSILERALRITHNDKKSTFEKLLSKDNSVSMHHRHMQVLATEMFKIKNNMASEILNEIFQNRT